MDYVGAVAESNRQRAKGVNPLGQFFAGVDQGIARQGARQKQAMNALAMKTTADKAKSDLKTAESNRRGAKLDQSSKIHELRMKSAETVAASDDSSILSVALREIERMGALLGEDPSFMLNNTKQLFAEQGAAGLRADAQRHALDAKTQMGKPLMQDTGGSIQPGLQDKLTGEFIESGDPIEKTATPGEQLKADAAEKKPAFELSEDAIVAAAIDYVVTGKFPSLGRGEEASRSKHLILNTAAKLNALPPEDRQAFRYASAARKSALTKVMVQKSMIEPFEKTFQDNAALALEAAGKLENSEVPIANKWVNMIKRNISGDADISGADSAIKGTLNEYVKIVSGSMGNTVIAQAEIEKVNKLLNDAQTPDQMANAIRYMKKETDNRMSRLDEQTDYLIEKLRAPVKGTGISPEATAAAQEKAGWTGDTTATPPPPAPAPAPAPALTNAAGWVLHTDANGNQAYVSPDGTQYEEVQ